jgi:restriction endonuclease S subunit
MVYDAWHHFQPYFSYIVAVSFIGGGNRNTRKKTPTWHKSLTNVNYSYDQITLIYLYLFLLVKAMFLSSVLNTDQTSTLLPLLNIGLWCLVCTEMYIVQVKNIVINRTYYLFKSDFYSQYKCRRAINEMFLYFNLCLSVMLDSLSCWLTCLSVMLDSLSCSLTSIYPFFLKEKKSTDNKLSFKSDLFNSTG